MWVSFLEVYNENIYDLLSDPEPAEKQRGDRYTVSSKVTSRENDEEGDDEEEEEDEDESAEEESKDIICDLPLFRFIIRLGAKIFLWPFIKLDLFDPFPPVTMDEAVINVRRRVVLLEKISKNDDVNDEQKDVLAKELKAIQASLKKIETITTVSSS